MNNQKESAKKAMIEWLKHPNELGKEPYKIECVKEFDLYDLHYYIFRFKTKLFDDWKLAVCGGYEENQEDHCGHIYSDMKKYQDKTAVDDAIEIVERIRAYWMNQAKQDEFQLKLKKNTKFRTQEEIKVEDIENQFVKTNQQYHLMIGEIDCPSGNIIITDPLAYLPSIHYSPVLAESIQPGKYPIEVSICKSDEIGLRMCTARLIVNNNKVMKYIRATATNKSVIKLKDGTLEGFPVDAGMICFCDEEVANEYRLFLDEWYKDNPNGNHYDDYFASFFAKSYQELPAYQREGGDFVEWTNPKTNHKMVMIASGFGDGFYNSYYGYDENNELSQIIVPLINPKIFLS